MTIEYKNLIDGELITTSGWMNVVNPANESVIGKVPSCGEDELNRAVTAARRAFARLPCIRTEETDFPPRLARRPPVSFRALPEND